MSDDSPEGTPEQPEERPAQPATDSGPGPFPGLPDIGDLFAQFEHVQERFDSAAAEASAAVLTGSAASGGVTIELSGDLEARSVHIDPAVVDPGDVSLLEDMVLAALRDVLAQFAELQGDVAGSMDALGIDLSGVAGIVGGLTAGGGSAEGVLGRLSDVLGGLGLGGGTTEDTAGAAGTAGTAGTGEEGTGSAVAEAANGETLSPTPNPGDNDRPS